MQKEIYIFFCSISQCLRFLSRGKLTFFLYLFVIYLFTDAHAVFVFGFNMSRHFTSAAAATTTICCPGCGLNILFAGPILIFICSALRLHLSDAEIRKFSVAVRFYNQ